MKKIFLLLLGFTIISGGFAQAPQKISYQAVVRDADNQLLINKKVRMRISILKDSIAGTAVYVEIQTPYTNQNGLATFEIGGGFVNSGVFSTIDWANGPYYIKIETATSFFENFNITVTSQLLSVPYALHSGTSEGLTLPFNGETSSLNYGIKIGHTGTSSGNTYGGWFESASPSGTGVCGKAQKFGVYGTANANSGKVYGGVFESFNSIEGIGVYGAGSQYGVLGKATGSRGTTFGGQFTNENPTGRGVMGSATATKGTNYGGYFYTKSTNGYGVYGLVSQSKGLNYGGWFETYSKDGFGLVAKGPTYAAMFIGNGAFVGNLKVAGMLIKAGGMFEIDHPLDPINKILRHSFVESPDMMNIYNGNIITDGKGNAVVLLPNYFETLNMDFRYQLTVIGDFAQAIIAEKIRNNRFTIRTDKPNMEVSWQVTGVRQDPWANENRIIVEENKKPEVRGHYLYPKGYGQPENRSVMWSEKTKMMGETAGESENDLMER
jgi:hypothetical protein